MGGRLGAALGRCFRSTFMMQDAASMNLAEIRTDYRRGKLRRADLHQDPIEQFNRWLKDACDAGIIEPTAMSLATAGIDRVFIGCLVRLETPRRVCVDCRVPLRKMLAPRWCSTSPRVARSSHGALSRLKVTITGAGLSYDPHGK